MIYLITGPSGVGKNTIIEAMSTDLDFYFSVSHTTRPQREREVDGKDYHFVTEEEFKSLVDDNLMIEYEQYGGFYYGTSKKEILKESNIILLDLEVNGATKLLSENDDYIGILIYNDDNDLVLILRNSFIDENFINKRMQLASIQREKKSHYQYHVDNVDIKTSVNQILDIIYALEESW